MVIPYFISVKESGDLRKILSQNIKKTRKVLHITQAKLAEHAGISVFHIVEIEQCKTWVSDKTLSRIAHALNIEVYELLLPDFIQEANKQKGKRLLNQQIAELIKAKKDLLRQKVSGVMEDLSLEIMHLLDKTDK